MVKSGTLKINITVLTLSNQATPLQDKHGYSLKSIIQRLARKKKGSKAFGKTQEHRKNFVNWSINQLNLKDIKEIRFEKVKHLRRGKRSNRKMSHWTYPLIEKKLVARCEEEKVSLVFDNSVFYSQRCCKCGLVLKSNRQSKVYSCNNCGNNIDSDLNSALNHQQNLPFASLTFSKKGLNKTGFFWKTSGFYDLDGVELSVPLPENNLV